MSQLEIKFTGAVLDLKIELEGQEVGLYFDGINEWSRTIPAFEVEGNLDVMMLCKGINGTKWDLEIKINGQAPVKFSGKVQKGYSVLTKSIVQ